MDTASRNLFRDEVEEVFPCRVIGNDAPGHLDYKIDLRLLIPLRVRKVGPTQYFVGKSKGKTLQEAADAYRATILASIEMSTDDPEGVYLSAFDAATARKAGALPRKVWALFEPPFTTDGRVFVYDRNGGITVSRGYRCKPSEEGGPLLFQPRGWGRHQYLHNGGELHDAWCAVFKQLTKDCKTMTEITDALNRAWTGEKT